MLDRILTFSNQQMTHKSNYIRNHFTFFCEIFEDFFSSFQEVRKVKNMLVVEMCTKIHRFRLILYC